MGSIDDYIFAEKIIPTRDKKLSKPVINNSKEEVFSLLENNKF
jgi:hypothetical protein